MTQSPAPIRVLIIDDSAAMRSLLRAIITAAPGLELVGEAPDTSVARQLVRQLSPDVLTLDIDMPGMNGLDFLARLMALRPMPVLMLSTLTAEGADATIEALALGAVDAMQKPDGMAAGALDSFATDLVARLHAAAQARPRAPAATAPQLAARRGSGKGWHMVAIGASTGGVETVHALLAALPADAPPILIVQHMPEAFTNSFARRLDNACTITVQEAADGMPLRPGQAYIAPGGRQCEVLCQAGGQLMCRITTAPAVSGHCPSVDVMFRSVVPLATARPVLAALLTGMGRDGADGLLALRQAGARTIAQSAESCVIYGMPRAAMDIGAASAQLPIADIASEIMTSPREKTRC